MDAETQKRLVAQCPLEDHLVDALKFALKRAPEDCRDGHWIDKRLVLSFQHGEALGNITIGPFDGPGCIRVNVVATGIGAVGLVKMASAMESLECDLCSEMEDATSKHQEEMDNTEQDRLDAEGDRRYDWDRDHRDEVRE